MTASPVHTAQVQALGLSSLWMPMPIISRTVKLLNFCSWIYVTALPCIELPDLDLPERRRYICAGC